MEQRNPLTGWGFNFRAGMFSAPVDSALLAACSEREWSGMNMNHHDEPVAMRYFDSAMTAHNCNQSSVLAGIRVSLLACLVILAGSDSQTNPPNRPSADTVLTFPSAFRGRDE
jgi:hypothetical protein